MLVCKSFRTPEELTKGFGRIVDVGGGSVPDDASNTLANPSLTWMINEIMFHTDIIFKLDAFKEIPGVYSVVGPKILARRTRHRHRHSEADIETQNTSPDSPTMRFSISPVDTMPVEQSSQHPRRSETLPVPTIRHLPSQRLREKAVTGSKPDLLDSTYWDALHRMYDQLERKPGWWILEVLPIWVYKQEHTADGRWVWRRERKWCVLFTCAICALLC